MKTKTSIIARAADDMFEVTELEGVIEFDKETARVFMRRVWKIAYKRGRIRGVKDERNRPKVTRVITKYVTCDHTPRATITNALSGKEDVT